jgi:hypothetical protein
MTPGELRERLEKCPEDLEKLRHAHDRTWNADSFVDALQDPSLEWRICQILRVPTEVEKSGQSAQTQFFLSLALGLITLLIVTVVASAAFFTW